MISSTCTHLHRPQWAAWALWQHIAEAQCWYQTTADSWMDYLGPANSKLGSQVFCQGLNISVQTGLRRTFGQVLACMKSCTPLHPFSHPINFHMTSEQYTWYSTSQCWTSIPDPIRIGFNQHPYPWLSKTNPNSDYRHPSCNIDNHIAANFNTLSNGWATSTGLKNLLDQC